MLLIWLTSILLKSFALPLIRYIDLHFALWYQSNGDSYNMLGCIISSSIFGKRGCFVFFFKILFIYLTEIETASERGNTIRGSGRGRSRLTVEEPDVGLDPTMLGSRPEQRLKLND